MTGFDDRVAAALAFGEASGAPRSAELAGRAVAIVDELLAVTAEGPDLVGTLDAVLYAHLTRGREDGDRIAELEAEVARLRLERAGALRNLRRRVRS